MSKFEDLDFSKVTIWVNEISHRVVAKAWVGSDWHEVTFAEGTFTLQHLIDALKEDLREPTTTTGGDAE